MFSFEKKMVKDAGDLYALTYEQLIGLERFADKSVKNVLSGIDKSISKTAKTSISVVLLCIFLISSLKFIVRCNISFLLFEINLQIFIRDKNTLKNIRSDPFMMFYYNKHKEDFLNPQHGMTNMNLTSLSKYTLRPNIYGAAGVIFYLSNKACDIVIQHMERINFNILQYDKFTRTYPYVIEDCGVAFIMYMNDIVYIDNQDFIYKGNEYQLDISEFLKSNTIVMHTNRYK
jgi:hypothetical protein